jgi:iron complex outermembrane receptor protein
MTLERRTMKCTSVSGPRPYRLARRRLAGHHRILVASLLLAALAAPAASDAQTSPPPQAPPEPLSSKGLEELMAMTVESVTGAARHEQPVTEAPASVTIVTARDIETFGWRTLAEVLESVRGFHVTYDRNYAYVGVRGFGRPTDYNSRVLVLVDGHRVNDAVYDSGLVGTESPLDLGLVDRIEIIRGPGSALYGTSAFFAVVNLITRRGTGDGARARVEAGTLETVGGSFSFGAGDGRTRDVMIAASGFSRGGQASIYYPEFDTAATNFGRAIDLDGDRSTSLYGAATLGRWRAQAVFGARTKDVPTASYGTAFNDARFRTVDSRGWLSLAYERPIGRSTVSARVWYDGYRYRGNYPYAGDEDGESQVQDDEGVADSLGGEITTRRSLARRHTLTAGVEFRTHPRQDQWTGVDGVASIDDRRSSREAAGYLQDEIAIGTRLTAIVGARFDWWSLKGGTGRPRAGVIYRPDHDTSFKVLYGEAYRAPNLYELYYGGEGTAEGNPSLLPEMLRTTEVVLEQYVKGRVRMAMSAFHTSIHRLIDLVENDAGLLTHINQDAVRAKGVELEAEGRWPSGILVRGSVSAQDAHHTDTDEWLSNAPHYLATMQVAVPVWRREVQIAGDSTFVSRRRCGSGRSLPAYALARFTATYRPVKWPVTLGASIDNLFDTEYQHPVGAEFVQDAITQDGRTLSLRLGVRF